MKVRMVDLREAKMCARGAREIARRHNLSWSDFVRDGIEIETLERIDDAMVRRACGVARGRQQ